jgi:polysaccharide pyruvyl transferase WcaK-like protein
VDALLANIKQAKQEGEKIIAVCPSILVELASEKNGLDYRGRILEIARYFEKLGKVHFVFLPNATREGSSKTANNDLLTIQRMQEAAQAMFEKPVFLQDFDWVTYDLNTASIRRVTSEADWLFTSRYHSMISGLCLGKKTVVIGWGYKYKETMDYFELGDCCLDFKQQDLNLDHFLEDLLGREKDIEQKLHMNKPSVVKSATQQKEFIRDFLR